MRFLQDNEHCASIQCVPSMHGLFLHGGDSTTTQNVCFIVAHTIYHRPTLSVLQLLRGN